MVELIYGTMLWLHTPGVCGKRRSIKEVKEERRYSLRHKMLYVTAQSRYLYVRLLTKVARLSFSNISSVTDNIKYYFPLQTDKIACLFLKEEPTAYSRLYR